MVQIMHYVKNYLKKAFNRYGKIKTITDHTHLKKTKVQVKKSIKYQKPES